MADKVVDLNCDMGESFGRWTLGADEAVMPYITSANIACGYHGGDPHVMRRTVALALEHGVAVGAHPGLPDLMGFGRRVMEVGPQEVKDYLCYQTGALREFARVAGTTLQHVKPHGILYNMCEWQEPLARAAGEAVLEAGRDLIVMAMASRQYDKTCRALGCRVASEGFADRAYTAEGILASRKMPGTLITDPQRAADQAVRMVLDEKVASIDGKDVPIRVQTICCHGDTPGAERIVRAVREGLEKAGIRVRPLRDWLPAA